MKRLAVLLTCVVIGCGPKAPPFSEPAKSMAKKFEQQMPQHKTVVIRNAVGPEAYSTSITAGFDVNVACAPLDCLAQYKVAQLDDWR